MGITIQAIVEVSLVQDDGSQSWDSACEWMFGKDHDLKEALDHSAMRGWPHGWGAGDWSVRRSEVEEDDGAHDMQWIWGADLLRLDIAQDGRYLLAFRGAVDALIARYGGARVRVLFYRT